MFLKYGKWGDPAYRIIRISPDYKRLEWIHRGEAKASNYIPVNKLVGIKYGRHTPNFKRHKIKDQNQEDLSFTIFGEDRNVDLEADIKEQKDLFVEALVSLIQYHKKYNPDMKSGPLLADKKKAG